MVFIVFQNNNINEKPLMRMNPKTFKCIMYANIHNQPPKEGKIWTWMAISLLRWKHWNCFGCIVYNQALHVTGFQIQPQPVQSATKSCASIIITVVGCAFDSGWLDYWWSWLYDIGFICRIYNRFICWICIRFLCSISVMNSVYEHESR